MESIKLVFTFVIYMLFNNRLTTAKLNSLPMWNISSYGFEPCSLLYDYADQSVTIFNGNHFETCGVELTSSDEAAIMIRIPLNSSVNSFVYAVRQGDLLTCQNRYVVIEADGPCVGKLFHSKLRLFLQGNISISIREMSTYQPLSICSERIESQARNESKASQTKLCPISEFNQAVSCVKNSANVCSFDFPIHCNATLRTKRVDFKCHSGSFITRYTALVIITTDVNELDLTSHRLVQIYDHPFHRFKTLNTIRLDYNILLTLPPKIFQNVSTLSVLSLRGNFLQTLPKGLFEGLTNLEILYLSNNDLTVLPSRLFEGLIKLQHLSCNQNKLKDLPIGLFKGLTNLLDLELHNNRIKSLNDNLFNETWKLINLALSKNKLTGLPSRIFKGLTSFETLYLDRNKLKDLPKGSFEGLIKVKRLFLNRNKIETLTTGLFEELSNLKMLQLNRNNLEVLSSGVFNGLINLETLYLNQNKLKDLQIGLFDGLVNLSDLELKQNKINSLDGNLFNETSKLVNLDLSNNNLTGLPKQIFKGLTNLETLNLFSNVLRVLPCCLFEGLIKLKHLYLNRNKMEHLPIGLFEELINLETLKLTNGSLRMLSSGVFKGLTGLLYLTLQENQIHSLDDDVFNETSKLVYLSLRDNNLSILSTGLFKTLANLNRLSIFGNNLKTLPKQLFLGLKRLEQLYLYDNQLQTLHNTSLQDLTTLKVLDLGRNQLVELSSALFSGLKNIQILDLNGNKLTNLAYEIFKGLQTLQFLFLESNQLRSLEHNLFQDTVNLTYLDLSKNELKSIPNVNNLKQLRFINLQANELSKISKATFMDLLNHTEIIVSQIEICECYASSATMCTALDVRSPYLTCDRLLSDKALVGMMWLIGINAFGGNMFVLCWRKMKHGKNKIGRRKSDTNIVQSFLLSNLAMSDLLMGIYMLLIASADIYFGDNFPMQAEAWRSGITCRIAGTISILSSEASVFFVTLISIERFLNIRYPFSQRKLSKASSGVVVASLWIIALILGLVSSSLAGRNYTFYDNSHVCIGLPLTLIEMFTKIVSEETLRGLNGTSFLYVKFTVQSESQGRVPGIYFATAMFLGLNCICYLIILICYIEIVRLVFKSSKRAGISNEMKKQIRMTVNIAAIVLTDFICWFPIILLGILVQARVLILPPSVYAWCVTFVLPINSAINPYLYTIAQLISTCRKEVQSTNSSRTTNENISVRGNQEQRSVPSVSSTVM